MGLEEAAGESVVVGDGDVEHVAVPVAGRKSSRLGNRFDVLEALDNTSAGCNVRETVDSDFFIVEGVEGGDEEGASGGGESFAANQLIEEESLFARHRRARDKTERRNCTIFNFRPPSELPAFVVTNTSHGRWKYLAARGS